MVLVQYFAPAFTKTGESVTTPLLPCLNRKVEVINSYNKRRRFNVIPDRFIMIEPTKYTIDECVVRLHNTICSAEGAYEVLNY